MTDQAEADEDTSLKNRGLMAIGTRDRDTRKKSHTHPLTLYLYTHTLTLTHTHTHTQGAQRTVWQAWISLPSIQTCRRWRLGCQRQLNRCKKKRALGPAAQAAVVVVKMKRKRKGKRKKKEKGENKLLCIDQFLYTNY